mgnify:CR=1 FL=1
MNPFTLLLTLFAVAAAPALAEGPRDPRFFIQSAVQRQYPAAFALQPEAEASLRALHEISLIQGDALVAALAADRALTADVRRFDRLELAAQKRVLRRIFEVQSGLAGVKAPALHLDDDFARGAFFEFDPARPDAGKVFINAKSLGADKNKFSALLLLIHELRHSSQFQLAFEPRRGPVPAYASGWNAAFRAQKALEKERTSFLDFMTLLNEYEAFRFSNYVVGRLLDFRLDAPDMGSYASQFDAKGQPKIDLPELLNRVGRARFVLEFENREDAQYRALKNP